MTTNGEQSEAARRAYETLCNTGMIPHGLLPNTIEKSWQRCLSYGLDSDRCSEFDLLGRDLLLDQLEQHQHLLSHAQPVIDSLFDHIVDTQSVIILASNSGYILHSCGDPSFLPRAEKVALKPGVEWSENCRGTNAIGTALAIGAPVVVHGDQHFLPVNRVLTCSASPIFDPCGQLAAVLDLTGDQRSFNPHTMALIRMSVKMIENRMFASAFRNALILRFHIRPEFVGTLSEGMAAFAEDGTLLSANRHACLLLGESLKSLRERNFTSLFGKPLAKVFDHLMVRAQDPMALTMSNGVKVLARADFAGNNLRRQTFLSGTAPETQAQAVTQAGLAAAPPAWDMERLRTGDPQIDAVLNKVKKVIGRDIPILIQGDTGTGKELLARAIHSMGPRAQRPFIAVNCAAIPEGLIESEMFGYHEGAFTGARRKGSVGRIQQADGGTLFLDEIGDMPLPLQARLLRVLQERVVTPLSSLKSYPVDIAVICATHRRIRELVSGGQFREDLYFRLNGLTVMLPPLRARRDLEALVAQILKEVGGDQPPVLHHEVLELFRRHPWPGNLRQLSNLLRTAVVMAEGEEMIKREHLPDDFIDDIEATAPQFAAAEPQQHAACAPEAASPSLNAPESALRDSNASRLQNVEMLAIRDAIARHSGNISAAARDLGVSRNTLYRKLKNQAMRQASDAILAAF